MPNPSQPGPPSTQPITTMQRSTTSTTTLQHPTTHSLAVAAQRPSLARRAHIGASRSRPWLKVLNRPTRILETILLNLSLEGLICAMHVSKTWLYVASESEKIRERLYWWHVESVIDSRPGTPRSGVPNVYELFHIGLPEGILITYYTPRRGEYFVLMKNHCEERSLRLLDSKKTRIALNPFSGEFHVEWYDHAGNFLIDRRFSPAKIRSREKMPRIRGDKLFDYFKQYHSPTGTDWDFILEGLVGQTRREKVKRLVQPVRRALAML